MSPMPPKGHFVLHSTMLPPVIAGRYALVSKVDGLPFTSRTENTHVRVDAPRFTMPTDQILSTFPPANGEGAFGDRLPQVVLKRRTLPWERNPMGGSSPDALHPWLALVVVAEGEGELSTATPVEQCVSADARLSTVDRDVDQSVYLAVTETVLKKVFPCEEDLPYLVHVRHVDVNDTELAMGDDDGWLSVVLANRLPVMDKATGRPVKYLACLVNLEGQVHKLPPPTPPSPVFSFELVQDWRTAVVGPVAPDHAVMGTGLAVQPAAFHVGPGDAPADAPADAPRAAFGPTGKVFADAALQSAIDGAATQAAAPKSSQWATGVDAVSAVALDPDAQLLVRDAMSSGWRVPISKIALEPVHRFPVLAYWSFTTTEGATFETLLQGLDYGLLGMREGERINPPADPPEPPPKPEGAEVMETGHLHLQHRTRRGDRTQAWYRGPLVPHPTLRDAPAPPGQTGLPLAHASDQLRRVVPEGGEDLSYAAAFEIGRLLALSQLSIVSALLRFRSEQFGAERARQVLDVAIPFSGLLQAKAADLSRLVSHTLLESLATMPDATLGPPRPIGDPGRPIDARGDLDEVIATGLGLDLPSLRKRGSQVGMLSALTSTDVPVAVDEQRVPGEVGVQALHASLDQTLGSAVGIALGARDRGPVIGPVGPVVVGPVRGPATPSIRRAGRPTPEDVEPDPLDELLAGAGEFSHLEREEE